MSSDSQILKGELHNISVYFSIFLSLFLSSCLLFLQRCCSLSVSLWPVVASCRDRSTRPAHTHQCLCETENDPAATSADLQCQCVHILRRIVKFNLFSAPLSRLKNRRDVFLSEWSLSTGGGGPVAVRDPGGGGPLGLRPPASGLYDASNAVKVQVSCLSDQNQKRLLSHFQLLT